MSRHGEINIPFRALPGASLGSASLRLRLRGGQKKIKVRRFAPGGFHGGSRFGKMKVANAHAGRYFSRVKRGEALNAAYSISKLGVKTPLPRADSICRRLQRRAASTSSGFGWKGP